MLMWCNIALGAEIAIVVEGTPELDRLAPQLIAEIDVLASPKPSTEVFYVGLEPGGSERALEAASASGARVVVAMSLLTSELALARGASRTPTIAAMALSDTEPPAGVVKVRLVSDPAEPLAQLAHILGTDDVAFAVPEELSRLPVVWKVPVVHVGPDAPVPSVAGVLVATPTARDAQAQLYRQWADAGVATMLLQATDLVDGVLGGYRTNEERHPAVRRAATATATALAGRQPAGGALDFDEGDLVLSAAMAAELGVSLPFDVLADAEVEGWGDQFPELSIQDAVAEAFANSPRLALTRARIGGENTAPASALASWLPRVDAGATALQLDESVGTSVQPVTSVTAQVGATQLLWSDQAATNLRVQRDLQRGRDSELVAAEQDLAYDVAVAFVQVERAHAVIAVRAADIDRARLSLRVARQRTAVGDAAASEVSRWEGEVANARAALVQSWTELRAAMVNLNLACGVDVGRMVTPKPDTLGEEVRRRLATPRELDRLATIIAEIASERAPELLQVEQVLRAQQRQKALAGRAYFMPTLTAQASANFNIYQAETDPIVIPGAGEVALVAFPTAYWAVGASATVPVFSGGQRRAEQVRAGFEVASSEEQQRELDLAVRSRAVIAVNEAYGATWQAELRRQSSEATLRSFESTQSAYTAGSATQTTVTEARTNALQVGLAATDARYEALLRYIDVLRSVALLPTPDAPDAPTLFWSMVSQRLDRP